MTEAIKPKPRKGYRVALERSATGAAAPSAKTLSALTPDRIRDSLREPPSDADRLGQLEPIRLVGDSLIHAWSVQDQGNTRQTCVPFAVSACIELLRARAGMKLEILSPQFLYWHIRTGIKVDEGVPGWKQGATKLRYAQQVLATWGICTIRECPYDDYLEADMPLKGTEPTVAAKAEAAGNLIANGSYWDWPDPTNRPPRVARMVYDQLELGQPVAIAVPQFLESASSSRTNWNHPATVASGILPTPSDGVVPDPGDGDGAAITPGHAVCVVGFQPDAAEASGGWFIFRNGVGANWAYGIRPSYVPARGYGAIAAAYVEKYCWEWLSPALG